MKNKIDIYKFNYKLDQLFRQYPIVNKFFGNSCDFFGSNHHGIVFHLFYDFGDGFITVDDSFQISRFFADLCVLLSVMNKEVKLNEK